MNPWIFGGLVAAALFMPFYGFREEIAIRLMDWAERLRRSAAEAADKAAAAKIEKEKES